VGASTTLTNGRPVPSPACLAAAAWLAQARAEVVWVIAPARPGLPCVALPASEARARGIEDVDADDGGRVLQRIEPRAWSIG
jgi:hypothetical protein